VEVQKVFEFCCGRGGGGGVVRGVVRGVLIIKAFDFVMHIRSFGCCFLPGLCPHCFDFLCRFSVIFGIRDGVVPFLLVSHHRRDDFLCVKMLEMLMNPRSDGCELCF
jgi:hypothetical protein